MARAAAILQAVAASPKGLSPRAISEQTGIRLPTTYHLLHTLTQVGLLRRGSDGKNHVLGLAVGEIAAGFDRQLTVPDELARCVQEIAEASEETVYGSGWEEGEIMVLAHVAGTRAVAVSQVPLGLVANAHARAAGKLLLALAPEEESRAYLQRRPPVPVTAATRDADQLAAELEEIRKAGYAVDEEEYAEGVCCLSAPLRVGSRVFAVTVSAPTERFRQHFDELKEALMEATQGGRGAAVS